MTNPQVVIITFLLAGALPCLSAEPGITGDEHMLSRQVKPINWKRFKESPPRSQHRELSGRILLNSARWGSGWIEKQYKLSANKDRYVVPSQNNERVIRPGCSVAAAPRELFRWISGE